jgi:hypothetical protein
MRIVLALALATAACGGDDGEPITGSIAMDYGGDAAAFKVGSVVEDENTPGKMIVQVGTNDVNCDTYLDNLFSFNNPKGTFLYFSVDPAPGTYTDFFINAMRSDGDGTKINASFGSVTIDTVDGRVTGTVNEFDTTDDEVGTITASGTFDVLKCF